MRIKWCCGGMVVCSYLGMSCSLRDKVPTEWFEHSRKLPAVMRFFFLFSSELSSLTYYGITFYACNLNEFSLPSLLSHTLTFFIFLFKLALESWFSTMLCLYDKIYEKKTLHIISGGVQRLHNKTYKRDIDVDSNRLSTFLFCSLFGCFYINTTYNGLASSLQKLFASRGRK